MEKNVTLHIFGYGETQYITEGINFKTKTSELTKVQAVKDLMWAQKPEGAPEEQNYHAITIFNSDKVSWIGGKDGVSFNLENQSSVLSDAVNELITEMVALIPAQEPAQ